MALNSEEECENGVNTAEITLHPPLQTTIRGARGNNVQFFVCELRLGESTSGSGFTFT